MIIHPAEQGTDEWAQARAGVITASDFHKVLARGKGKEPSKIRAQYMHELANEILTQRADTEGFSNGWMERGKEVEDQARAYYELMSGEDVTRVGLIYKDESRRIGCSADSLVGDSGGLEIKSPKLTTHLGYVLAGSKVPSDYVSQVQGCLYVTERHWWDFMSFHPYAYRPSHIVRTEPDAVMQDRLHTGLTAFIEELDDLVIRLRDAA